jgi:hypothetical protein
LHGDALCALAEVLRLASRPAEAGNALEQAAGLFDLKGNIVSAANARAALAELRRSLPRGRTQEG